MICDDVNKCPLMKSGRSLNTASTRTAAAWSSRTRRTLVTWPDLIRPTTRASSTGSSGSSSQKIRCSNVTCFVLICKLHKKQKHLKNDFKKKINWINKFFWRWQVEFKPPEHRLKSREEIRKKLASGSFGGADYQDNISGLKKG